MAIHMNLMWDGVTPEQYDKLGEIVQWESNAPKGALFHVASFGKSYTGAKGAIYVTDVWETAADFDNFLNNRLMPGVQKAGIAGQPTVVINEAHATFLPDAGKLKGMNRRT